MVLWSVKNYQRSNGIIAELSYPTRFQFMSHATPLQSWKPSNTLSYQASGTALFCHHYVALIKFFNDLSQSLISSSLLLNTMLLQILKNLSHTLSYCLNDSVRNGTVPKLYVLPGEIKWKFSRCPWSPPSPSQFHSACIRHIESITEYSEHMRWLTESWYKYN